MVRPSAVLPALIALAALTAAVGAQRTPPDSELGARLVQIGERVQEFYSRAQSIVYLETVNIWPLGPDMAPNRPPRRLVYEVRISWESTAEGGVPNATIHRELLTVGGRPPRPGQEPRCIDPGAVSPEPLAMFLPVRREAFAFAWLGTNRVDGRPAVSLSYRPMAVGPAAVTWGDECVYVDEAGSIRGRVWADAESHAVLRLDEFLTRTLEFAVPREERDRGWPERIAVERADRSIRYKPVRFTDPDETVVLPASAVSVTVFRGSGEPRLRTTQVFSDYRRFLTEGRIVD
jgi:hypothetical protein